MAIHREPCYIGYKAKLPETEGITDKTIILPLYPSMTDDEVRHVIECVCNTVC